MVFGFGSRVFGSRVDVDVRGASVIGAMGGGGGGSASGAATVSCADGKASASVLVGDAPFVEDARIEVPAAVVSRGDSVKGVSSIEPNNSLTIASWASSAEWPNVWTRSRGWGVEPATPLAFMMALPLWTAIAMPADCVL